MYTVQKIYITAPATANFWCISEHEAVKSGLQRQTFGRARESSSLTLMNCGKRPEETGGRLL